MASPRRKTLDIAASGLVVSYDDLDSLKPNPRNTRTHSAAQIASVARSLSRFGWAVPMGKRNGMLIYGSSPAALAAFRAVLLSQ